MSLLLLRRFPPTRQSILVLARPRATYFASQIAPFVTTKQAILDIGVGTENVTHALQTAGFNVTPLDVQDLSFTPKVEPIIYDGQRIPFPNKSFDVALISTVLHHANDPDSVILEAKRVAHKLIIIEDVHLSWLQKRVTQFVDSLLNLEFFGHPHSNRTDAEWRATFKRLGLRLTNTKAMRSFVLMNHQLYVLDT